MTDRVSKPISDDFTLNGQHKEELIIEYPCVKI